MDILFVKHFWQHVLRTPSTAARPCRVEAVCVVGMDGGGEKSLSRASIGTALDNPASSSLRSVQSVAIPWRCASSLRAHGKPRGHQGPTSSRSHQKRKHNIGTVPLHAGV